jgi:4-amino-4-deoxy-L-arabinose transferase-like glycosyltransferase
MLVLILPARATEPLRRRDPQDQEGAVEQEAWLPIEDYHDDHARPHSRRFSWLEPVLLALWALGLNLAGNDRTGLWDRDEPRYAVCVREMRSRGDWINPTFNGEPRFHKPILIYWLIGLSTALAGDNPFGVRLVSSLAGAGTVLGVWWLGRRMLGPRAGRLAGLIYATAPIVVAESKLATTDATLALWLFGCQVCLWRLSRRPSPGAAAAFWVLLSLTALTKGPIGPVLLLASAALAWRWGWPVPPRQRLHWRIGLAGFLALTAPWFLAVSITSKGEFLRFAVGKQILTRVASDLEAHGGFPGYYPVVSLLVFFPWSALVPAAIVAAWPHRKSNPDLSFLLGWAIAPVLVLECFQTKLIHYYLPAFPALALLTARLVDSLVSEGTALRQTRFGRLGLALLVGIGLGCAAALMVAMPRVPWGLGWPLALMAIILGTGMMAGTFWFHRGAVKPAIGSLAATQALILVILCGWLIPQAETYRTARIVGERLAAISATLGLKPVLLEYQEPGVIYALGHPVALTRDRDDFFAHLHDGRSVLTVAVPSEIEVMRSHFKLEVTPVDQIEGFVLNRGKPQVLQIAVVRQDPLRWSGKLPPVSTTGIPLLKQTLVK